MTDTASAVTVGPAASALRREVGPTAWVVLESMLAVARRSDGHVVADVSVRQLAEAHGLAKNTIARAVATLRRARLVAVAQARANDGAFGRGDYVLSVPHDALAPTTSTITRAPSRHPRTTTPDRVEQLVLLPE